MTQEEILEKICNGSALTIRRKVAHLDKYTKDEVLVNYEYAVAITLHPSVDCWGGNYETGDKHYEFKPTIKEMSKQHTPTPYKFQGKSKNGNHFNVVGTKLGGKHKICIVPFVPNSVEDEQEAESIAKFIVKACNNHDRLVETLEATAAALLQITSLAMEEQDTLDDQDEAMRAFDEATKLLTELNEE